MESSPPPVYLSTIKRGTHWVYLFLALVVVVVIPLRLVFRGTIERWTTILSSHTLLPEISYGFAFAAIAGLLAHGTAVYWTGRGQLGRWSQLGLFLICLPGLSGSFLMSMTIVQIFQNTPLHPLYDTPLPLVLGLYLFVLPRAILIQFIRRDVVARESVFLGEILRHSPDGGQRRAGRLLRWEQQWWPQFWCFVPLFFWSYFDMTTASILAPPATTPAPVRLYNMMHYGQASGLSALLSATIAAPCLLMLVVTLVLKLIQRRPKRLTSQFNNIP